MTMANVTRLFCARCCTCDTAYSGNTICSSCYNGCRCTAATTSSIYLSTKDIDATEFKKPPEHQKTRPEPKGWPDYRPDYFKKRRRR